MARVSGVLASAFALGGCLLGWEPDLDSGGIDPGTDGSSETGTGFTPTCEPPATGEPCALYDHRQVTIGPTLTPEISSDVGFSDLYVYRGPDLLWHAWSDDLRSSLVSLVYGQLPAGVSEGGPAVPLEAGVPYEVKLDAVCFDASCAAAVSSVYQEFTASP